jgi:agmatinase
MTINLSGTTMLDYLDLEPAVQQMEDGAPPHPDAGFLGGRVRPEDAALLLLPIPWEVTTSYGSGTSKAPGAIIRASHQLDLQDLTFGAPYRAGIGFLAEDPDIAERNRIHKAGAQQVISALEQGKPPPAALHSVNSASAWLNQRVEQMATEALHQGKRVGLVGGDHACPFGLIAALAKHHPQGFGILHIDAHHDLRAAYEGFTWSHASIFFNVMEQIPQVTRLVQLGVRDFARAEQDYLQSLGERARCFYDAECAHRQLQGEAFSTIIDALLACLPQQVYISLDIDGLEPGCCPSTGTPVPGGLTFQQAGFVLERLAASGRQVIGFDLCEVSPSADGNEWDANVGARVLYKLCGCCLRSQGLC